MTQRDADCLIVGGGIGGAVLALSLARRGWRVLILEREATPLAMPRPEILAGATVDALATLGVGDRILQEAALPLDGLELFESTGARLFQATAEDLRAANARPHSTDPARTRQIILEAAEQTGKVTLQRGVEVLDLQRELGVVTGVIARRAGAPVRYQASLTIGDDGTRSKVREAMGSTVTLRDFPIDFFGAVIPRPSGQPERTGQGWVNLWDLATGLFAGLFLPIPGQRTAVVFGASPGAAERFRRSDPQVFYMAATALAPLCRQPGLLPKFPEEFGYFRRPFGHTSRYVADGVALLGDAAHPVTPAGGQGANMSVADAMVLADVAEDSLRSGDVMGVRLCRYEILRWEANARSLQFSERPATVLGALQAMPMLTLLLRAFIRLADQRQDTKHRFIGGVARAFVSGANLRE